MNSPLNAAYDNDTKSIRTSSGAGATAQLPSSLSDDRLKVALVTSAGADVTGQPATASVTSVDDSATNVTLIAANSAARERIIQNDSTSTLYVKFGITASATDYTVKLFADDILTTKYAGRIDGIWSANSTGAAKITEIS